MTLGARLSALHRGIYRTPARACVLQDLSPRQRAPKCPGVVHRETRASALSGRGASRVRPECKAANLSPRGTAPASAFGLPPDDALVTRRDACAYRPRWDYCQGSRNKVGINEEQHNLSFDFSCVAVGA